MKKALFPHITVDTAVRFGKPVIAGTRIPIEVIVGKIAGGMTTQEVMKEYGLEKEQVLAALKYAAKVVASEELVFT